MDGILNEKRMIICEHNEHKEASASHELVTSMSKLLSNFV
jgi:hypothetical protein